MHPFAPADQAEDLMRLVTDKDNKVGNAAMKRLVLMKHKSAAQAIAFRLGVFLGRREAIEILQNIPESEAYVIQVLSHNDFRVVAACCNILATIGTKESIRPINVAGTRATQANHREAIKSAQDALAAIQLRTK